MAEYATMSMENIVKIDPKFSLENAALVGCAVTTGVGAVFNTAKVEPGSIVAVFGCGGVGLNAIQGARSPVPSASSRSIRIPRRSRRRSSSARPTRSCLPKAKMS
jgi:Zn-dependent alcohol dehydrogenase